MLLGALCVIRYFRDARRERGGESLPDLLRCFTRGRVRVEAEVLLALMSDEFGPALFAQNYRQSLKPHPPLVGGEFVESPFDIDSLDGHSDPAPDIGASRRNMPRTVQRVLVSSV